MFFIFAISWIVLCSVPVLLIIYFAEMPVNKL